MTARRTLAAWTATAALALVPAGASASPAAPHIATAAKTCSGGYVPAVISRQQKCLRRGQFCARAADRQYRRYGFRCTRYDANVDRYRLT
jgi:hypothetical protein